MYTVTCESTCDLPFEHLQKRNCPVIFYTYVVNGVEHQDNMERDVTALPKLFAVLATQRPTTSQINVQRYEEFFLAELKKGDVLHIAFSSGLSNSVSNAQKAAENIQQMGLPHKLVVVDSLCGGGGYGLLVDGVLDKRDEGTSFEQLCIWAMEQRHCVQHRFFSTDLTYFRRSGRVSGAAMLMGNVLHICPIMRVDANGKIVAYAKPVTVKKAIAALTHETLQHLPQGVNYDGKLLVYHSNCFANALQTVQSLQQALPHAQISSVQNIGTVMSCHCGPNTVAVFFWGAKRN